jgi:hypothetical protein
MVFGIISLEYKHIFYCIEYKKDYILLPFSIKSWQDLLNFSSKCVKQY